MDEKKRYLAGLSAEADLVAGGRSPVDALAGDATVPEAGIADVP
jgi:hypothetical protein